MKLNHSLNFRTFPHTEISLPINDRGFMYGDGFFETLTLINHKIRFWDYHWKRILKGCSIFHFENTNISEKNMLDEIEKLSISNALPNSVLKINFWRKEGGLFTPTSNQCNVLIQQKVQNSKSIIPRIKVGVSQNIINYPSAFSELKTMSSAKYVLVGLEIMKKEIDDLVINDQNGFCSELSSSNLFMVKDQKILTPPISSGCVDGVFRKALLDAFPAEESNFSINELKGAEFIFATNASGIKVINQIDEVKLPSQHPMLDELEFWLKQQQHL